MIILKSMSQLDEAAARAAKLRPKIRVRQFGSYLVNGSKGNWYEVTCRKDAHGARLVYCSCEETYPRKENQCCYHIVPAVGLHIILALARDSFIDEQKQINFFPEEEQQ